MGKPLWQNSLFLLMFATSSLFVGAAFIYMASKSPFFWGGLFLPGVILLVAFAVAALLSIFSVVHAPLRAAG